MSDDFAGLDATAQAELVRLGQCSAKELVDAAITRIEAVDPQVRAFTTTRFDRPRQEAAGDLPDGPFRGVPFALKDLSCTLEGEPSYDGVPVLVREDYRAPVTSHLAARFRRAGLVIMGRTSSPSSASCRRPSPWPSVPRTTRGTSRALPAARPAARRPRWRPA